MLPHYIRTSEIRTAEGASWEMSEFNLPTQAQEPDEIDELGEIIRRCVDGSRAVNASQISSIKKRQAQIQKELDRETEAHCHRQLRLCLMRSGAKPKFASGNDPRHI